MERLLEVLQNCCPNIDFENETNFITDKLIDSIDLVQVISDIEDEFDISIGMQDTIPENFDTVEAMWEMIQRLG